MAEFAGEGNFAFVEGDNLRNIVEPNAKTFHIVDIACRDTVELLEDVFLVFFGNADTVVGYLEDGKAGFGTSGNGDVRLVVRVFYSVVDEVVQHIGDVQLVGIKRARNVAEVGLNGAVAILKSQLEILNRGEYETVEVNLLRIEGKVLARHLGTLQQRFNKDAHTAVLVANDVDKVKPCGSIAGDSLILKHLAG